MNLILIRHGEIPSNIKKIYAGKSSEALTESGVLQAEEVSRKLNRYDVTAIYSSPIQRALQTSQIISAEIGVDIIIQNAVREMEMGPWEGLSEKEVADTYPDAWEIWNNRPADLRLPGRESLEELQKRVLAGIERIRQNAEKGDAVIVTHVAVIRVLLLWNQNKSLNIYKTIDVPNARIFKISL